MIHWIHLNTSSDAYKIEKLWQLQTCVDQIDKEGGSPFVQSQGFDHTFGPPDYMLDKL